VGRAARVIDPEIARVQSPKSGPRLRFGKLPKKEEENKQKNQRWNLSTPFHRVDPSLPPKK
jgi:hypothetical protein